MALTQQSMFAPDSMFGSVRLLSVPLFYVRQRGSGPPASMLKTLSSIELTFCTGDQRSDDDSYILGSSPGECRIDMHTFPSA